MIDRATLAVSPASDGLHDLCLQGQFDHPHWIAFLFSGLASHEVSIVGGRAAQAPAGNWDALFYLDFRRSRVPAQALDFRALCEKPQAPKANAELKLTSFQVVRRFDQMLEVRVSGPDQVGFLGALLSKVSLFGLFPIELEIETVGARIQDRLVFTGIARSAPTPAVETSLKTILGNLAAP